MDEPSTKRGLTKRVKSSLAKQRAAVEKARAEVLDNGSKYLKPLGLARHKVLAFTVGILVALALAFLITVSLLIYVAHNDSYFVYRVARILPFPVAKVNGSFVSYADYAFEVRYRKNIYANPTGPAGATNQPVNFKDASAQDLLHSIQQSALLTAKLEAITKQLAKANNVSVPKAELDQAVSDLIAQQGGEQKFASAIKQYYNWSLDDFRHVYYLQLLQQKLELVVLPQVSEAQHQQAEAILAKANGGADFAKLAKHYSQDEGTKNNGGDLGFISATSPYVDEFKNAALALSTGQVSDIITTQFGFHIIKATDKQGDQVRVSHILIKYSEDIQTYLTDQLAKASVRNFIKLAQPAGSQTTSGQ